MLFIKVENNNTVNHPVTIENLMLIYPNFDVNNPPDGYLPFNRASIPTQTSPYIIHEPNYSISNNIVNEIYIARMMTNAEKQELFSRMEEIKPYPSWTLNEEKCLWEPPISYPSDRNKYVWSEDSLSWIILEEL
jgi:hypothetical protein